MLEVDCTMLTPDLVLRTSGHEKRFSDYIMKDVRARECFRANQLLEDHLEKLASKQNCTQEKIKEYKDVIARVSHVKSVFSPLLPPLTPVSFLTLKLILCTVYEHSRKLKHIHL